MTRERVCGLFLGVEIRRRPQTGRLCAPEENWVRGEVGLDGTLSGWEGGGSSS